MTIGAMSITHRRARSSMATARPARKVVASGVAALVTTFVVALLRHTAGTATSPLEDLAVATLIGLVSATVGYVVRPAVRDTVAFR